MARTQLDPEPEVFSIDEFCHAYRISRASFYRLVVAGQAPRVMKVGGRRLITREDATTWRKAMTERS
jgi:predicted DNA-binding transcriptional regulator AlpA